MIDSQEAVKTIVAVLRSEIEDRRKQMDRISKQLTELENEIQEKMELARNLSAHYGLHGADQPTVTKNGKVSLPDAIDAVLRKSWQHLLPKQIASKVEAEFGGRLRGSANPNAVSAALGRCHAHYGWRSQKHHGGSWRAWIGPKGGG